MLKSVGRPRSQPGFRPQRLLVLLCVVPVCLLATGCFLSPNARKQKFLAEGDRYFTREKFPEALVTYGRALQIDPRYAPAHYGLAKCHIKMGNWPLAFQELLRTVDLEPKNWPAHLDLGQLNLAAGRAPQARDEASLILQADPNQVAALVLLSDSEAAMGNLKAALADAVQAVSIAPTDPNAYLNLAAIQQKLGTLTDAEASLLRASSLSANSITANIALGNFYQAQKRWRDAEAEFRRAIATAPQSPLPRASLAGLFLASGRRDLAEQVLLDARVQLPNDPVGYTMLGAFYLSQGDNTRALAEFTSLAKEHPNDFKVRKSYAQLLIMDRQFELAAQVTGEILRKSPQDVDGLILRGEILLQNDKPDEALQTLQEAVKIASANALAQYQLGMAYFAKGSVNQAENAWRQAVQLNPGVRDAWIALGNSISQRRDWTALEPIGNQLKKITPAKPEGYLFHATARINQGDVPAAEADLQQLLRISPESALGYTKLGQLRTAEKRWNEAEAFYAEALQRDPQSLEAIRGMLELDFSRGQPGKGITFVQAQIALQPGNAALRLLEGQSYLRENQLAEAERSFLRCVEIDAQNSDGFALLGRVQQGLGKYSDAVASIQHAIALSPKNAGFYGLLGMSLEATGDWQAAQTAYQRALAIQPEEPLAANNLAYLMLEHNGNVNVALTLAQTGRRGLPDLPNSADTLGWAYFHNGAYSMAAEHFEEAIKAAPSNATYHYHLGMTYQKLNDSERARTELLRAINLDPKAPSAEKASRLLANLSGAT